MAVPSICIKEGQLSSTMVKILFFIIYEPNQRRKVKRYAQKTRILHKNIIKNFCKIIWKKKLSLAVTYIMWLPFFLHTNAEKKVLQKLPVFSVRVEKRIFSTWCLHGIFWCRSPPLRV